MSAKIDAFAYFGITQRNPQCSWSGHSVEHNSVAFSIHPVFLDMRGPIPMYRFHRMYGRGRPVTRKRQHGLKWLIEDHRFAVANTNGLVHCVWTEPFNYCAPKWVTNPQHTAPCKNTMLELVGPINEQTGYYEAKVIWLPTPIAPALRVAA